MPSFVLFPFTDKINEPNMSKLFVLSLSFCFKLKDFDLFNSTKSTKQINLHGLHEINCSNSTIRGLQLQITKPFVSAPMASHCHIYLVNLLKHFDK